MVLLGKLPFYKRNHNHNHNDDHDHDHDHDHNHNHNLLRRRRRRPQPEPQRRPRPRPRPRPQPQPQPFTTTTTKTATRTTTTTTTTTTTATTTTTTMSTTPTATLPTTWTSAVMHEVKGLLYSGFRVNPSGADHPAFSPAKAVQLGFHDCFRYKDMVDGSFGGCDGCLQWHDKWMFGDYGPNEQKKATEPPFAHAELQETTDFLEGIYSTSLQSLGGKSLQSTGHSRADLWAFSAFKAIEFAAETNNKACDGDRGDSPHTQCLSREGEGDCKIDLSVISSVPFRSGRGDCIPMSGGSGKTYPAYATWREEVHPSADLTGEQTVRWFETNFGLSASETVAAMGAHTLGRFHQTASGRKYSFTSRSEGSLNNQYYRNMALRDDWHFNEDSCAKVGTAWNHKGHGHWITKTLLNYPNGGPVHWIFERHVCPNCKAGNAVNWKDSNGNDYSPGTCLGWACIQVDYNCCQNIPEGAQCKPDNQRDPSEDALAADIRNGHGRPYGKSAGGCEHFRFVEGRDDSALTTDMGLYLKFEVDEDGFPRPTLGCENGHEYWNWTMFRPSMNPVMRQGESSYTLRTMTPQKAIPQEKVCDGSSSGFCRFVYSERRFTFQSCSKNEYKHTESDQPLYKMVENFADNQSAWIEAFMPAFYKLLSNGAPWQASLSQIDTKTTKPAVLHTEVVHDAIGSFT
eukprot:TRINITY_DN3156_c0_g1_i10.p1 TRINITY_DN3156_c0_g1~~TRINITY_DN3156_c0_g1_i10.p1  ORF type:complete len:685 (+),score=79.00 TRINITY_DN3156_c0_g1_i10:523-2577(+)